MCPARADGALHQRCHRNEPSGAHLRRCAARHGGSVGFVRDTSYELRALAARREVK
jgi:hypothetical protein